MRRALISAVLLLGACGDDNPTTPGDAGSDAPDTPTALAPCLDEPTQLARPPEGVLPCDLLPPGFTADRSR